MTDPQTPGRLYIRADGSTIDVGRAVRTWRGKVPASQAARVLGISTRSLEDIEHGLGYSGSVRILFHFLKHVEPTGERVSA